MTHSMIRRFKIDGVFHPEMSIIKVRESFEKLLTDDMRIAGYVPLFDVVSAWSTTYMQQKNIFEFLLTMHGVYVGEDKAWQIEGIQDGKELPKPTPQSKSPTSSKNAE